MITNIKITDKEISNILLFNEIKNVKKINILFGGNGVGKTTLLNAIKNSKIELNMDKDIIIKSYTNSVDNTKINNNKDLITKEDFIKAVNIKQYSEGQSIMNYVLSFFAAIKEFKTDKDIVILLDEVDSGLSAENINVLLWQIKDLINTKNVQFFIATNSYHWTYVLGKVLNMYTGEYININSYEEYFNILNKGIQIMNKSKKRNFDFLNIY